MNTTSVLHELAGVLKRAALELAQDGRASLYEQVWAAHLLEDRRGVLLLAMRAADHTNNADQWDAYLSGMRASNGEHRT